MAPTASPQSPRPPTAAGRQLYCMDLGYSYRYFAQSMYPNPDTKLLSVDGHAPTDENIMNGNYPFVAEVYAVTNGRPEGAVAELIEWILSPQGQYLVEQTGYAPIK